VTTLSVSNNMTRSTNPNPTTTGTSGTSGGSATAGASTSGTAPVNITGSTTSSPAVATYRPLTILDLPTRRTKSAPDTFRGDYTKVQDFIDHYERLLHRCNVTSDREKCKSITQYCSKKVAQTIEGMPDYIKPDWDQLKDSILEFYDAERNNLRFNKGQLRALAKSSSEFVISSLKDFRKYQQEYIRIAGWLLGQQKIEEKDFNRYFWRGLNPIVRTQLEIQILRAEPNHNMEDPFDMKQVSTAAEKLFMRTRFDKEDSDTEDEPGSDSDSDSSTSDSSDDEEENSFRPKAKSSKKSKTKTSKMSGKKVNKLTKSKKTEHSSDQSPTKEEEVEKLLEQMINMDISDPKYRVLYYKALVLDRRIEQVVQRPRFNQVTTQKPSNEYKPPLDRFHCFGCGATDHGIGHCPVLETLKKEGVITKSPNNKYIMADGLGIYKQEGETLADAARRQHKTNKTQQVSHFITLMPGAPSSEPEEEGEVFGMKDRPSSKPAKETFDGVFPPSRQPARGKGKENEPSKPLSSKPQAKQKQAPVTIPMDMINQNQSFDPENDDDIMEDDSQLKNKSPRKPRVPYASELSKQVNPVTIMNKVLDTPVTLSVGELMGGSKELSTLLQKALQFRKTLAPPEVVHHTAYGETYYMPTTRPPIPTEPLIRIPIQFGSQLVDAIIDTGSTASIMNTKLYSQLQLPIDRRQTMAMADANGGAKNMEGLVQDVPLICGGVKTLGDIYVAAHVPFMLLLGRPWQRKNYVAIDERSDGTYVVFKDPYTGNINYEIKGTPTVLPAHQSYFLQDCEDIGTSIMPPISPTDFPFSPLQYCQSPETVSPDPNSYVGFALVLTGVQTGCYALKQYDEEAPGGCYYDLFSLHADLQGIGPSSDQWDLLDGAALIRFYFDDPDVSKSSTPSPSQAELAIIDTHLKDHHYPTILPSEPGSFQGFTIVLNGSRSGFYALKAHSKEIQGGCYYDLFALYACLQGPSINPWNLLGAARIRFYCKDPDVPDSLLSLYSPEDTHITTQTNYSNLLQVPKSNQEPLQCFMTIGTVETTAEEDPTGWEIVDSPTSQEMYGSIWGSQYSHYEELVPSLAQTISASPSVMQFIQEAVQESQNPDYMSTYGRIPVECESRTCHGSVQGARPIPKYMHEVLFDDALSENDTMEYLVCSVCNRMSKKRSQGGTLVRSVPISQHLQEIKSHERRNNAESGHSDNLQPRSLVSPPEIQTFYIDSHKQEPHVMTESPGHYVADFVPAPSLNNQPPIQECNIPTYCPLDPDNQVGCIKLPLLYADGQGESAGIHYYSFIAPEAVHFLRTTSSFTEGITMHRGSAYVMFFKDFLVQQEGREEKVLSDVPPLEPHSVNSYSDHGPTFPRTKDIKEETYVTPPYTPPSTPSSLFQDMRKEPDQIKSEKNQIKPDQFASTQEQKVFRYPINEDQQTSKDIQLKNLHHARDDLQGSSDNQIDAGHQIMDDAETNKDIQSDGDGSSDLYHDCKMHSPEKKYIRPSSPVISPHQPEPSTSLPAYNPNNPLMSSMNASQFLLGQSSCSSASLTDNEPIPAPPPLFPCFLFYATPDQINVIKGQPVESSVEDYHADSSLATQQYYPPLPFYPRLDPVVPTIPYVNYAQPLFCNPQDTLLHPEIAVPMVSSQKSFEESYYDVFGIYPNQLHDPRVHPVVTPPLAPTLPTVPLPPVPAHQTFTSLAEALNSSFSVQMPQEGSLEKEEKEEPVEKEELFPAAPTHGKDIRDWIEGWDELFPSSDMEEEEEEEDDDDDLQRNGWVI
jgi:hypothetical protein